MDYPDYIVKIASSGLCEHLVSTSVYKSDGKNVLVFDTSGLVPFSKIFDKRPFEEKFYGIKSNYNCGTFLDSYALMLKLIRCTAQGLLRTEDWLISMTWIDFRANNVFWDLDKGAVRFTLIDGNAEAGPAGCLTNLCKEMDVIYPGQNFDLIAERLEDEAVRWNLDLKGIMRLIFKWELELK